MEMQKDKFSETLENLKGSKIQSIIPKSNL